MRGGKPVQLEGTTLPLWGMEVNIDEARQDMKDAVSGPDGLESIMDDVGLGMFTDQLKELKLGELLENPPPGSDEAIAIASVRLTLLLIVTPFCMKPTCASVVCM